MEKKNKGGRPTKYSKWKAKAICMRIMDGESLRSICSRKYYPSRRAVFYWLNSNAEFLHQYTQAREIQQELFYDELFEIADDGSNDYYMKTAKDGSEYEAVDHENINRSRLRVDTRKWVMERMAAKKYGNKQQVEHSGSVNGVNYEVKSDDPKEAANEYLEMIKNV